jgi:putative DNA primase/helicase
MMTFVPENIPQELMDKRQWVNWDLEIRDGKQTKVPKQPNGRNADSTDPGTWSDFEACVGALENGSRFRGIGFVFNHDYTGTDFDDCVLNGGIINPDVARLVAQLNSYTEYSQSKRGLHVINNATKPGVTCRKSGSKVEMYDSGRFFCMTGDLFDGCGSSIEHHQEDVDQVYYDVFGDEKSSDRSQDPATSHAIALDDRVVIEKASAAKNGDKFKRLFFDGDVAEYAGDDSAADLAICDLLTFWCGDDRAQIDHIFRQSQLMRSKWDRPTGATTYGEMTISKAIEGCEEVYQGQCVESENAVATSKKKPLSELVFDRELQHELCVVTEDKSGNEHVKPVPGQIAKYLQDHYFDFITFRDNEQVYYYDQESGLYVKGGESKIKEAVEIIIGDPLTTQSLLQIIEHIKRQTFVGRADVDAIDLDRVAIGDGILNTRTREIVPFGPKHIYLSKLPPIYDQDAPTDEVEKYVNSTFHPDDVPWLQEYYGWHLEPSMRFQKDAMLLGSGDNGKTVFENILIAIFGEENVASISIQDMNDDKYATAELYQKVANIYDDLPAGRIRDSGQFKILTGNGRARAQVKYQQSFYFYNRAKGTYSANKLPGTRDLSFAFFKRWLIAEMPYRFVDRIDIKGNLTDLGDDERHKIEGIVERMTTPAMLSAWLNWMLDGLDRLRANERFSSSKTQEDIRDIWLMQTSPISMFVKDCISKVPGKNTEKKTVYNHYLKWCEANEVDAEKEAEFAKTLRPLLGASSVRPRSGGKRPTCWEDIVIKGEKSCAAEEKQGTLNTSDDDDDGPGQSETEAVTGFGQGGQGITTQPYEDIEKKHMIGEMYGNTPDHPDQTTQRASLESGPYNDDDFLRMFRVQVGTFKICETAKRCELTRESSPAHICREIADEHHIHLDDIIEHWERIARNDSVIDEYFDDIFGGSK